MRTFKISLPGRIAFTAMLLTALSVSTALADGVPPPDPSDSLLFVRHLAIGRQACDTCIGRVCPGETAELTVSGLIPAGCVQFRGLHLLAGVGTLEFAAAEFFARADGDACVDGFELEYIHRSTGREAESATLADGQFVHAGVAAEHFAAGVDDLAAAVGRRQLPLDESAGVAIGAGLGGCAFQQCLNFGGRRQAAAIGRRRRCGPG